jgi:hypothetical protein
LDLSTCIEWGVLGSGEPLLKIAVQRYDDAGMAPPFPEPRKRDETYAKSGEGTVSWLSRSTLPLARNCRDFLNRNLHALPDGCRKGIHDHLRHDRSFNDGFFELIVGRALQEMGADIECEPENPRDGTRVDFVARFSDGTVFVEAVSPVLDRELGAIYGREAPLKKLIEDNVPTGWAADIRAVPRIGPGESRRHVKAFLQRER